MRVPTEMHLKAAKRIPRNKRDRDAIAKYYRAIRKLGCSYRNGLSMHAHGSVETGSEARLRLKNFG